MWPPEQVNGLLSQCNKWKKEIVKERVPPDVWKAISKELKMTDQGSWQLCREKFSQMNRYFIDTILPGKGFLGEDMWAYYEEFCELYDIPEDYHQVINDTSANEEEDDDDYEDVQNNDGSISKSKFDSPFHGMSFLL